MIDVSERPSAVGAVAVVPVGAMIVLSALVFGVIRQGAYHQWGHQVFASVVILAGIGMLFGRSSRQELGRAGIVVLPLVISSMISTVLSENRGDARSTFLTLVLVGIAIAAGRSVDEHRRLATIDALVFVATLVAITAIVGVATHETPWGRITEGVWRGSSSLTYANAAASLAGPVGLLTFMRAAVHGRRLDALATAILLLGFISTQSRGGFLALTIAGVVVLARLRFRLAAETALPIAIAVSISAAPMVFWASDSKEAQPTVVFVAVVVAAVVLWFTWPQRLRLTHPDRLFAALIPLAIIVVATTSLGESIRARATFRSGTTAGGEDAAVLFGDRAKEWSVAWDRVQEAPLIGHGPGVVDLSWVDDGRSFRALFVHNEYLELLVTHGIVGGAALLGSVWLFSRRCRLGLNSWPLIIATGAFLVHSTLDYLWHLPALPVFFALMAALIPTDRSTVTPADS